MAEICEIGRKAALAATDCGLLPVYGVLSASAAGTDTAGSADFDALSRAETGVTVNNDAALSVFSYRALRLDWMKATLEAIAFGHPQSRIDDLLPLAASRRPPLPEPFPKGQTPSGRSPFGRAARNCRFTLSSGHGALRSLTVVLTDRPRTIPCKSMLRISRATVQRATFSPS